MVEEHSDVLELVDSLLDDPDDEDFGGDESVWKIHPNVLSQIEPPEADVVSNSNGEKMSMEEWNEFKNRELLLGMLNLDNPVLTHKMIDFLMRDRVCEMMLSYITRLPKDEDATIQQLVDGNQHDQPLTEDHRRFVREEPEPDMEAVKKSFQVMSLLTNPLNEPSSEGGPPGGACAVSFLDEHASTTAMLLFQAFKPHSKANFYHVCRVLDRLYEAHADHVIRLVGSNFRDTRAYLGSLLDYIHYPPVSDLLLQLLLPRPASGSPFAQEEMSYQCQPQILNQYYKSLSKWKVVQVVAERVYDRNVPDAHAVEASNLFQRLVNNLSVNYNGELLFQPLGHCPEIVKGFIDVVANKGNEFSKDRVVAALGALGTLVDEANKAKNHNPVDLPQQQQQPQPTSKPFASVADRVISIVLEHCQGLYDRLLKTVVHPNSSGNAPDPVKHSGYVVASPFTHFRLQLVEVLAKFVCYNPTEHLSSISAQVWRVLIGWLTQYPHTNLYHSLFCELFKTVVMCDESNHPALKTLMQKCKVITVFTDYYTNGESSSSVKGHILTCLNIVRLNSDSLPVSHFLRQFLKSHASWRAFMNTLRARTMMMTEKWNDRNTYHAGEGVHLPFGEKPKPNFNRGGFYGAPPSFNNNMAGDSMFVLPDPEPIFDLELDGIDLGSPYADSLGFEGVVQIDEDDDEDGERGNNSGRKKKKKNKKKNSNKAGSEAQASSDTGASSASPSNNGTNGDSQENGSTETATPTPTPATPPHNTSNKKKKKKKKRK